MFLPLRLPASSPLSARLSLYFAHSISAGVKCIRDDGFLEGFVLLFLILLHFQFSAEIQALPAHAISSTPG